MRLRYGVALACAAVFAAGVSMADPNAPVEPKSWTYDFGVERATYPEVEPNDTCPTGQIVNCGDVIDPASIASSADVDFYTLQSVAGGTIITVGTDASGLCDPDVVDSYVELYYNCGTTRVAYDDDSGPGAYSLMTYTVPAGSPGTYTIKVRGYSAAYTGCYKLSIGCTVPQPPPVNDTCAGALPLDRCAGGTLAGDNTFATNNYDPTSAGCTGFAALGKDVAYVLNLQAGDILDVTYTATADGSVYLVTDCANVVASCVIGADDTVSGQAETFSYPVVTSGTYYLILDSYGTNTGTTWTLLWSVTCPPPTGACCYPDGSCVVQTATACSGVYQGDGTLCDPNNCPQPTGACCIPGALCQVVQRSECDALGGTYFGDGSTCDPDPCYVPPTGACCLEYVCTITTQADCFGTWYGDNSVCDPSPCPPPPPPTGACCVDFVCTITTQSDCMGIYFGDDTVCDPSPCPPPPPTGACCYLDGTCSVLTQAECEGTNGAYYGDGSLCDPNPCPGPVPVNRGSWGAVKHEYH